MEPTLFITYVVLGLLIAQALVPANYRWPLRWLATLVAGAFVIADTPTIPLAVKLVAWLAVVALTGWRWRRDQYPATESA